MNLPKHRLRIHVVHETLKGKIEETEGEYVLEIHHETQRGVSNAESETCGTESESSEVKYSKTMPRARVHPLTWSGEGARNQGGVWV